MIICKWTWEFFLAVLKTFSIVFNNMFVNRKTLAALATHPSQLNIRLYFSCWYLSIVYLIQEGAWQDCAAHSVIMKFYFISQSIILIKLAYFNVIISTFLSVWPWDFIEISFNYWSLSGKILWPVNSFIILLLSQLSWLWHPAWESRTLVCVCVCVCACVCTRACIGFF